MNILGVSVAFPHDPSAALVVNGEVIAAAEEERFTRIKHAHNQFPVNAIMFCLETAGLKPDDIDIVAYPWHPDIYDALKWKACVRMLRTRTSRALKVITRAKYEKRVVREKLFNSLTAVGFNTEKVNVQYVEHHIAHASSAYHLSGFDECAIMSIDGVGELTSCLFAHGKDRKITKIKEIINPDSLGRFYSTVTAYLGFEVLDGEYKLMGMAPFGDAGKIDMSHIIWKTKHGFRVNDDYVWPIRSQRYDPQRLIPKKMVAEWGPIREGDKLSEPYIHIAAATQKVFEEMTFYLIEKHLVPLLQETGNLCFAGGCALNVSLNRKLIEHPLVKRLWVQPAAHDSGTALGAAVYVSENNNIETKPMEHVYLGPWYSNAAIEATIKRSSYRYELQEDICDKVSTLLHEGNVVGWFQGRMEFGPRALGARSILGNPGIKGTADKINEIIKFREVWRPFCPSILPEYAEEILGTDHPAPFMTFSFTVTDKWKEKIPEVVHVDGTARPQIIDPKTNPRYYEMVKKFHKKSGLPVVINTSLNRRGEPMICSPEDALKMFDGSGLEYLAIGDYLVTKKNDM